MPEKAPEPVQNPNRAQNPFKEGNVGVVTDFEYTTEMINILG